MVTHFFPYPTYSKAKNLPTIVYTSRSTFFSQEGCVRTQLCYKHFCIADVAYLLVQRSGGNLWTVTANMTLPKLQSQYCSSRAPATTSVATDGPSALGSVMIWSIYDFAMTTVWGRATSWPWLPVWFHCWRPPYRLAGVIHVNLQWFSAWREENRDFHGFPFLSQHTQQQQLAARRPQAGYSPTLNLLKCWS